MNTQGLLIFVFLWLSVLMSVSLQLFRNVVQESFQLGKEELVLEEEVLFYFYSSKFQQPFPPTLYLLHFLPCKSVHLCAHFGSLIKEVPRWWSWFHTSLLSPLQANCSISCTKTVGQWWAFCPTCNWCCPIT